MKILIIVSYLLAFHSVNAQKTNAAIITASASDSVYIPMDLNDCFKQLDSLFTDRDKTKIKSSTEFEFTWNYYEFGMWMRNNWRLNRKGFRLSKYFNSIGIEDPLDMTGIIFDSYHRQLTGKEKRLDEQIKTRKDELERKKKEFARYHINDTVIFHYSYGFASKAQEKKSDNNQCNAKGIITEKRDTALSIKVRLLDACDKKGIVSNDTKGTLVYNKDTNKFEKPEERTIVYMKPGEELWFNYFDWKTKN